MSVVRKVLVPFMRFQQRRFIDSMAVEVTRLSGIEQRVGFTVNSGCKEIYLADQDLLTKNIHRLNPVDGDQIHAQ